MNRTRNPGSGPRSGRLKPKKTALKQGKAKMSLAAWNKLSRKQREIEHHGTRFRAVQSKQGRGSSERS
jgi:hypothetical protein